MMPRNSWKKGQEIISSSDVVKTVPIRVGDKFSDGHGNIWEVIRLIPGGKLDLIDHARSYFSMRYHREVRNWDRIA